MQTLLSKATCLLVSLTPLTALANNFVFFALKFIAPMEAVPAQLLVWTIHLSLSIFLIMTLLLIAIKYMSVYHNNYVSLMDENVWIAKIKVAIIFLPILLAIFEYFYVSDITDAMTYQIAIHGLDKTRLSSIDGEKTILFLTGIVIAAMIGLQACIEYDSYTRGEIRGLLISFIVGRRQSTPSDTADNNNPSLALDQMDSGYKISSMRIIMLLGVTFCIIVMTMTPRNVDIPAQVKLEK